MFWIEVTSSFSSETVSMNQNLVETLRAVVVEVLELVAEPVEVHVNWQFINIRL